MTTALIDDARAAHEARSAAQYASVRRVAATIAIGVTLALVLRSVALEPFNIPSRSMLPTLQVGDYLFVAKWPYGYSRFSLPLGPALWDGRIGGHGPERGDVVVFKSPADNRADFIKRVVGLPGDRVRMTGGRLEINGALVPCAPIAAQRCTETLGGRRYQVADLVSGGPRDDTPIVVVPPGSYFVLGDNRDDSADSRMSVADGGVGLVPLTNLVGRAEFVFFSADGSARLARPLSWLASVRTDRIGRRL